MAQLSTFMEEVLLDNLLTYAPFHIALYTSDPQDDNLGTEVSALSYARQPITFARTNSELDNTGSVAFPEATESWGTITHIGILDQASGGNLIMHGPLATDKPIDTGETITFPVASVNFELD